MTPAEQFFEKGRIEGERKGKLEGMMDSIELTMNLKFGEIEPGYMSQIRNIKDIDVLKDILRKIQLAGNVDEIKEMLI